MSPRNRAERREALRRAKRAAAAALTMSSAVTGAISLIDATPAGATTTYTVTNLNATGIGSLYSAIKLANANPGADIIDFQAGLTGTITLTAVSGDLPVVTDDVDIRGPGAGVITVDGANNYGLFRFLNTTSSISGLTLTRGNSRHNFSDHSGGGIALYQAGNLTVTNMVVTHNYASNDGGGVWCHSTGGVLPNLTVTHSLISGNNAYSGGGGMYTRRCNATVGYTTVDGNRSHHYGGGGLYLGSGTTLVRNSTISNNRSSGYGGGGLKVDPSGGQTFTMVNSTVSGNSTSADAGGGLYVSGGVVNIIESTITGNSGSPVGGLYAEDFGAASAAKHTHARNGTESAKDRAAKAADIGAQQSPTELNLVGTIVAGNTGFDVSGTSASGSLNSDHSLLGTVNPATVVHDLGGTLLGANPLLGPLADNGGPTLTHALLTGSPAIDAGPPTLPTFPGNGFDQRGTGFARVNNGRVDIGAFEFPTLVVARFTG